MNAIIGQPISRVDGPAKVTGQAIYAAEFNLRNMAYAALVHSTIARGRIERLDATSAEQAPGVLAVISHLNAEHLPYKSLEKRPPVDPKAGEQLHVFQGPEILFVGQPVAVVVAETVEQARAAAALVQVVYYEAAAATELQQDLAQPPTEASAKAGRSGGSRGDAATAFTEAPVKVDMWCSHEREHHNAMEPHATIAEWDGDHLTLYDKSQWVDNVRSEIAHVFGMPEENIRVVSPFVGGAFGSALRTWPHVTIAALAARRVGRAVRLELTRRELYVSIGYRPRTEQHMQLGANPDGRLLAIMQDAVAPTSVYEEYAERTTDAVLRTYSCANVQARYRLAQMNANTPCPMRAPGLVTGAMAIEMAMDEMAEALGMDPIELRLRNYAERDEAKGVPWSSTGASAGGASRPRTRVTAPRASITSPLTKKTGERGVREGVDDRGTRRRSRAARWPPSPPPAARRVRGRPGSSPPRPGRAGTTAARPSRRPGQRIELHRLPDRQSRDDRQHDAAACRYIQQPLHGVVLRTVVRQPEAQGQHGIAPDLARTQRQQPAPDVARRQAVTEIDRKIAGQQPHRREVPGERPAKPAAQRQPRREHEGEQRRGVVDVPAAADHHRHRRGIGPVRDPHDEWMDMHGRDSGA